MITCQLCGRGALKSNWKSHSNQKTIRQQKLNLQTKRIDGVKMRICTNCIKTLAKQRTR